MTHPMYYAMMAALWLAFLFSAALLKNPHLKNFFAIGQGLVIGHVLTLLFDQRRKLPLRALSASSGAWQPISSAPKDGLTVLLYAEAHHRRIWGRGFYFQGVPGDGEGWIAHTFYTEPKDDLSGAFEPTHWMPLPRISGSNLVDPGFPLTGE